MEYQCSNREDLSMVALATTSYAILGYLAVRPWTAYELTKQLGRTFHHFWPRAESGIYRELKRLAADGYAVAGDATVGRRSRTRYDITDDGRRALAAWLAEPRSDGFLESEGLVRLLFADHGTKDDVHALLAAMVADADARAEAMATVMRDYLVSGGQFPDRTHINVLIARFLVDFGAMVERWADWSATYVATWPDTRPRPADDDARRRIEEVLAARVDDA
jgi:DNA-binding PadR family transcriptional regulator